VETNDVEFTHFNMPVRHAQILGVHDFQHWSRSRLIGPHRQRSAREYREVWSFMIPLVATRQPSPITRISFRDSIG